MLSDVLMRAMRCLAFLLARRFGSGPGSPVLWAVHPDAGQVVADPGPAEKRTEGADPDDLHNLMVDHSEAVYRLALSVVRDRALAEDVTQDTMMKAWLALPTFRGDSSLRGWVMRIAHNTAISTLRSRRSVVSDPSEMPEAAPLAEHSTARRVEGAIAVDAFVDALNLLDDLSRSIVVLRELEGMSYEEISEVLEVPLPTIKTRLLRARRRLGTALKEWQ